MIDTKDCSRCERTLPLTEFYRMGRNLDGSTRYRADCKHCFLEAHHDSYDNDPAYRARILANGARAYGRHHDEILAKRARYRDENREAILARQRDWYAKSKTRNA